MNNTITHEILSKNGLSYSQYIELTKDIISNPDRPKNYQDEKMLQYTKDNLGRMEKIATTLNIDSKLYNEMQQTKVKQIWVCITEPWCGDASQIVPGLFLIASCSPNVDFKILLRDSNAEVMDNYLTNGGKSIPKLVVLKADSLEEISNWGPRPASIQKIVEEKKNDTSMSFGDKVRMIHGWYEQNNSYDLQEEFITIVKGWKKTINA